jgi:hypothetical protein
MTGTSPYIREKSKLHWTPMQLQPVIQYCGVTINLFNQTTMAKTTVPPKWIRK